jgi:hypothetical protein
VDGTIQDWRVNLRVYLFVITNEELSRCQGDGNDTRSFHDILHAQLPDP